MSILLLFCIASCYLVASERVLFKVSRRTSRSDPLNIRVHMDIARSMLSAIEFGHAERLT